MFLPRNDYLYARCGPALTNSTLPTIRKQPILSFVSVLAEPGANVKDCSKKKKNHSKKTGNLVIFCPVGSYCNASQCPFNGQRGAFNDRQAHQRGGALHLNNVPPPVWEVARHQ